MRVLHLDSGREMRGGQWQVLRLHGGLVERGHNSFLLAREGSPLLAAAREHKLPCDVLRPMRVGTLSRGYDIVHAHDARSHTIGAVLARGRFVASRRVAFPVKDSLLSRWKYGRPDLFLAVSKYVASQLVRAGVDQKKVAVVYDGVPLPEDPASGEEIIAPYTRDPQKGMGLAQEAVRGLKVSGNLERDLPNAKALVYLTQTEGLGSGILLGMAYGVTVIASKVGGVPELITDGVNGLLVENTVQSVASAVERIDARIGAAARETVRERFSIGTMIENTLRAYANA
jgi:glycosyltransferase involved in cell wall biosynthesis